MPTTWTSRNLWECEECGAILGVAQIKVKTLNNKPILKEQTADAFSEDHAHHTNCPLTKDVNSELPETICPLGKTKPDFIKQKDSEVKE